MKTITLNFVEGGSSQKVFTLKSDAHGNTTYVSEEGPHFLIKREELTLAKDYVTRWTWGPKWVMGFTNKNLLIIKLERGASAAPQVGDIFLNLRTGKLTPAIVDIKKQGG